VTGEANGEAVDV